MEHPIPSLVTSPHTALRLCGVNKMTCLRHVAILILTILLSSCATHSVVTNITKQLPSLKGDAEVVVYDMSDTVPENAEILGDVIINFFGTEENGPCTWEEVLETAKGEARAIGGNGVEIQCHFYTDSTISHCHAISAFILNINDAIIPQKSKMKNANFHDYVVMKEGDTIPCSIAMESKDRLLFYHGYNRQGYRKSLSLPKSDLLSYHIEDPDALEETQRKNRKHFTMQFAVNGGYALCMENIPYYAGSYYSIHKTFSTGFIGSSDVRFNVWRGFTIGAHYGYYHGKGSGHFQPQNGSGYITNFQQKTRIIAGSFGFSTPRIFKRQKTRVLLGEDWSTPSMKKHWITYEGLIGFLIEEIDKEHGDSDTDGYLIIGQYFGYDYMLTKHLAIGATLGWAFNFNGPFMVNLSSGIRYYL